MHTNKASSTRSLELRDGASVAGAGFLAAQVGLKVDILCPAGLEDTITGFDLHNIRARLICVPASSLTTAEADLVLYGKEDPRHR